MDLEDCENVHLKKTKHTMEQSPNLGHGQKESSGDGDGNEREGRKELTGLTAD